LSRETGPGVPEALPRVLRGLENRLGAESIDRLWIFPPLVRGRKEWGLVAVSVFHPADGERRLLFSAPWTAERTGTGTRLETRLDEQGEAPPDRLPRVMDGVARRSVAEERGEEGGAGEPREVRVGGDGRRFAELMDEFGPDLLDPEPPIEVVTRPTEGTEQP